MVLKIVLSEVDDNYDDDEIDPWPIRDAKLRVLPEYEELLQNFMDKGNFEYSAKMKAFLQILLKFQKRTGSDVYVERLNDEKVWERSITQKGNANKRCIST